jgi:cold shock CspA family protein
MYQPAHLPAVRIEPGCRRRAGTLMPAADRWVGTHGVEIDEFVERATRELQTAVELISVYAALLDAQLAEDRSLSGLRPVVRRVRAEAELVSALLAHPRRLWFVEPVRARGRHVTCCTGAMQGVVSKIVPERGFGFVAADGEEYFFNQSALMGVTFSEIAEWQTLNFEAVWDAPGDEPGEHPRAVSVRLADFEVPAEDNELLPEEKIAPTALL